MVACLVVFFKYEKILMFRKAKLKCLLVNWFMVEWFQRNKNSVYLFTYRIRVLIK